MMKKWLRISALLLCAAMLLTCAASAKYTGAGTLGKTTVIYSKAIYVTGGRAPFSTVADSAHDNGFSIQYFNVYEGVNDGWYFVYLKGGMGGFCYYVSGGANGNGGRGGVVKGYVYLRPGRYALSAGSNGFNGVNDAAGLMHTERAFNQGGTGGSYGSWHGGGGGGASSIYYIPQQNGWEAMSETNVIAVAGGGGGGGNSTAQQASHGGRGGMVEELDANECTAQTHSGREGFYGHGSRGQSGNDTANRIGIEIGDNNGDVGNGGGGSHAEGGYNRTNKNSGGQGGFMSGGDPPWNGTAFSPGGGGAGFYGGGAATWDNDGKTAYGSGGGGGGGSYLRNDANFEALLEADVSAQIKAYTDALIDTHQGIVGFSASGDWNTTTAVAKDVKPCVLMAYLGKGDITNTSGWVFN